MSALIYKKKIDEYNKNHSEPCKCEPVKSTEASLKDKSNSDVFYLAIIMHGQPADMNYKLIKSPQEVEAGIRAKEAAGDAFKSPEERDAAAKKYHDYVRRYPGGSPASVLIYDKDGKPKSIDASGPNAIHLPPNAVLLSCWSGYFDTNCKRIVEKTVTVPGHTYFQNQSYISNTVGSDRQVEVKHAAEVLFKDILTKLNQTAPAPAPAPAP